MSKQIFIVKLWNIISFMYIIITKYNCKSDYNEGGIMKNRIGQLFIVGFPGKEITPELKNLIHEYNIGGVILFAYNIGTPKEVLELTTALQKEAKAAGYKYPLLIAIDEENGTVKRLGEGAGEYPGAMAISATKDSKYAYEIGKATGNDLLHLGINWNYAPVLDVNNNPNNPVISVRSFGETPEMVSEFGIEFMKGLQSSKIATALKHFPGHGDTNVDSHYALPIIEHDMKRLEKMELVPFKEAIAEGADSIMTAHIVFPALESEEGRPATLSKNIITGLLRKKLEFDGVIVTDALEMDAIAKTIGIANGSVEALKAGVDNVLIGHLPDEQLKALKRVEEAVNNGEIPIERIEESLTRVNKMKEKYLSWEALDLETPEVSEEFNSKEKQQLAQEAYENSVTVLKVGRNLSDKMRLLVLQPKDELRTVAEDVTEDNFTLTQTVKKYVANVDVEIITNSLSKEEKELILKKSKKADRVILGTMVAKKDDDIIQLAKKIGREKPIDIISMKSPYIGKWLSSSNYWINTYEPSKIPVDIAVRTLLGEVKPSGVSPVTL